jgi:hypothetical protein
MADIGMSPGLSAGTAEGGMAITARIGGNTIGIGTGGRSTGREFVGADKRGRG